eukprot:TRINITY_DN3888_c0_g1_i1.p1 TRINITY_DN3888_c0_g1~~TRINITY_DN3888_c0_g1_i1.p1  ORF type:complete len:502 (+),score=137.07 TRINITY_DN3888_c0_g1_i1:78-1583(+)
MYNNYQQPHQHQQHQQNNTPNFQNYGTAPTKLITPPEGCKTIWAGDLHGCDEIYVKSIFSHVGEVVSVKLIKDKNTQQPTGYGFVEFATPYQAQMALNLNGTTVGYTGRFYRLNWAKNIPNQVNDQQPQMHNPRQMRGPNNQNPNYNMRQNQMNTNYHQKSHHMNHNNMYQPMQQNHMQNQGFYQQQTHTAKRKYNQQPHNPTGNFQPNIIDTEVMGDFSIFVGDLGPEVNDYMLRNAFQKYKSLATAKVILDPISSVSKMYGFVSFNDANDYHNALAHMGGTIVGTRPIKVNTSKKEKSHLEQQFTQNNLKFGDPKNNSSGNITTTPGITSQKTFNNMSLNFNKEGNENTTILFIGSLSGETSEDDLFRVFNAYGEIRAVKLSHNKDCGFIDFYRRDDAKKAFVLDGTVLDGKKIVINWGNSTAECKSSNPRFKRYREDKTISQIPVPTIHRQPNFQEPFDVQSHNQYFIDNNFTNNFPIQQEYLNQIIPSRNGYQALHF